MKPKAAAKEKVKDVVAQKANKLSLV